MTAQQIAQELWNLAVVRVPKRVFIARALAILAKVGRASLREGERGIR